MCVTHSLRRAKRRRRRSNATVDAILRWWSRSGPSPVIQTDFIFPAISKQRKRKGANMHIHKVREDG